jgi:pterin-4a-carbinolamine dehydratase
VADLLPQASGWAAIDDATKLEGHFSFKNFRMALDFVSQVGELAETEFHHLSLLNTLSAAEILGFQTKVCRCELCVRVC